VRVSDITIDYLADRPEFIHQLAQLAWEEWQPIYRQRGQTFDDTVKNYRERTNTDRLPLTLVALHDQQFVGMVSLKYHDLDIWPGPDPWLGGLLVLPDWRGRGIAAVLIRRAIELAKKLKLPQLLLWTSSAEGLYLRLGWQVIQRMEYCGKQIVVMGAPPA
jgi:GNAT superfamily N-acetyltransferase